MKLKLTVLTAVLITSLQSFSFNSISIVSSDIKNNIYELGECTGPSDLKFEISSKNSITLAFKNSPNDTRTFEVRAFKKGGYDGDFSNAIGYATSPQGSTSITISGLSPKKDYDLVFRAICHPGTSPNKVIVASTTSKDKKTISFKKELKTAKNAVYLKQYGEAVKNLNKIKPSLNSLIPSEKAQYYSILGLITGVTNPQNDITKNKEAISYYNKAQKIKNSEKITSEKKGILNKILNTGIEAQQQKSFGKAAEIFEYIYNQDKSDTIQLYYAANNATNAKNYDLALKHYNELMSLDFTGIKNIYKATNVATGKVQVIGSKKDLDALVQQKRYAHPKVEVTPSQKGQITKNIALIYYSKGETAKAEAAFDKALAENPNDSYIKKLKAQMFGEIAVKLTKQGKTSSAIEYYAKAIEIDPKNPVLNQNITSLILQNDIDNVKKMNALGRTKDDLDQYKKMEYERIAYLNDAAKYLENYLEVKSDDKNIANSLYQIYNNIKSPKADALKAKYGL